MGLVIRHIELLTLECGTDFPDWTLHLSAVNVVAETFQSLGIDVEDRSYCFSMEDFRSEESLVVMVMVAIGIGLPLYSVSSSQYGGFP